MTIFAGSPRLLRSVGPFVAIVVLQALLAAFSMETLSSVRAYVAGESLWSKGQKGAVYALTLYAESGEEAHYRQYLATISVPMGDRMARRALEQAEPDSATAFQGFLQGGNQREDIAGMIWLFRYFGDIGHLKTAVDRWRDTDAVIEDLLNLGVEIHLDIVGGGIEPGRIEEFKRQIHQVNDRTTPLAVAFSESLGNGSRWITRLLLVINLFTATLLVLLGVWRIRSLLIERHGFEAALAAEKERLAFQANHDDLTGLANRRELEQQLAHVLPQAGSASCRHVLMFLDLDQFKVVNDTCGHAAGDRLLRQLSGALKQCLRAEDLLARLGGDEFAVLLVNCSPDNAAVVAEKLRRMVQDLKFVSSGRAFDITVSIGVVCITESDSTVENVLRAADIACYIAKENGRNRVEIYSPSDAELQRRVGEMSWVQRIQAALEDDRFCLHAQRIVPLSDGAEKELHLELLLRLQDEDGRLVAPGNFIPAAERYGLMSQIDRWVIRNAFSILADRIHQKDVLPVATCAINLSGDSFRDEGFLDFVRAQLLVFDISPQTICFEITETCAIANLSSANSLIRALHDIGCRFSLDDFGSGMSSFAYLKHLSVDYIKIDGSFVKDMLIDPIDRAMVEMIVRIGKVMGKQTIAEFVESDEIRTALRDIGVDYAQGYAIGKPEPFGIGTHVRESLPTGNRHVA